MHWATMLLSLVMATATAPTAVAEEGFAPLFDGQSFQGWEGNLKWFRIEDGAIVAGTLEQTIPRNEFLCTTKGFSNFELRLKFKLRGKDKVNAGVQIRSRRIPNHHEMIGYQADLGENWYGCLYDESRRKKVLAGPPEDQRTAHVKMDGWNDYTIRCEGPRIQLWINGHKTVDYTETDKSIEQIGVIGLQIHSGPAAEAWYKDVRIKELGER